jgi:3-oxoacyl-[acyl-carrier protein] reductase
MPFNFRHRSVIVTGGSRGIGRAIALAFAGCGANVSICARGVQALEKTRSELANSEDCSRRYLRSCQA